MKKITNTNKYNITYKKYYNFFILEIENTEKNSFLVAQTNNFGLMEYKRLNESYFTINQENALDNFEYEPCENITEEESLEYHCDEFHTNLDCIDDSYIDDSYEDENINNLLKLTEDYNLGCKYRILLGNDGSGIREDYLYCNSLKQAKAIIKSIPKDLIIQIFLDALLKQNNGIEIIRKLLTNERFFNGFINNNYKQLLSFDYSSSYGGIFYNDNLQKTLKI